MAVVNSATVVFGAKLAITDENLNVYKLQTPRTDFLLVRYDVANVPSPYKHVKRSLETSKLKKKAKSADLVILSQSQLQRVGGGCEGGHEEKFYVPKRF